MKTFSKKRISLLAAFCIVLLLAFTFIGCSDDDGGSSPTESGGTTGLPADPGAGNLAGKVVGTINGGALSGITVTVNSISTVTASDGTFTLTGVGTGNLAVVLTGSSIYTRTAAVNTSTDGRSVLLDAIEANSSFYLDFYREIARGNHPDEGDLLQTHRWTGSSTPTVYINTNSEAALDGTINNSTISAAKSVVSEVIPVFTGGVYSSVTVKTKYFSSSFSFSDIPDNSIVLSFDDTLINLGAYGITYTDPDFTSASTSTINKAAIFFLDSDDFYESSSNPSAISLEEIVAHETGHGMGFRHTSLLPSVMTRTDKYGGLYSTYDQLHMAIVYSRPAGNTDIDNDPVSGSKSIVSTGSGALVDNRANFPISSDTQTKLQSLQRFDMVEEYFEKN